MIERLTIFVLPCVMCIVAVAFLTSKNGLTTFNSGAVDGMKNCIELLPTLLLIMCSVNALFASGLADVLTRLLSPFFRLINVPDAMIPTIILRPFSGSGVTALAKKLFSSQGADSSVSKTACLLMGSTDTILYTLSMYMSGAKIKKTRYALPASLVVFLFSIIFCSFLGNMLFS